MIGFLLAAVVAFVSFRCTDLFSSDLLPGAICPLVFLVSSLVLLVKIAKVLGVRVGAGGGSGDGVGGDWFGDGDGGGDGGGGD